MFAVLRTGGKQYKVKEKQTLRIEKLPAAKDAKITLDQVLLVSDGTKTEVGTPLISKAKVEATVMRQDKAKKVSVTKYKAKTRYKRVTGHRQQFSEIRIDKITN